jgi:hypothetical protein
MAGLSVETVVRGSYCQMFSLKFQQAFYKHFINISIDLRIRELLNTFSETHYKKLYHSIVKEVIKSNSQKHHHKIAHHPKTLLHPIIEPPSNNRRLKRKWPADLLN